MKVKLERTFQFQATPTEVVTLAPGIHDLPKHMAEKVLRFGKASLVRGKTVPENKLATVSENKARVGKTTKRRRSTRPKPKR